jgi:hypothetical protein
LAEHREQGATHVQRVLTRVQRTRIALDFAAALRGEIKTPLTQ